MNNLHIMIGVAGSGKSTYVRQHHYDKVFSSDEYRLDMFGSLKHNQSSQQHVQLFKKLHNDLKHYLDEHDEKTIAYDATNLSRKRRHALYNDIKKYNVKVTCVVHFASLETLQMNNLLRAKDKQVPYDRILQMYLSLQIPQINFDCDDIKCVGEKWFRRMNVYDIGTVRDIMDVTINENIKNQIALNYSKHYSPYHAEDIHVHIAWAIDNAKHDKDLKQVAIFHDLGKGMCQKFVEKDRATYHGHEMLGAQFALNYFYSIDEQDNFIPIVVAYHMLRRQEMKPSKVKRMMTHDKIIQMLDQFNEVDNKSRIIK